MVKIEGLTKLIQRFGNKLDKARRDSGLSVIVGYTANYAVHVHESMKVPHKNGQAKFLEQPAREMGAEIGKVVGNVTKSTGSLEMGLLAGGMLLQRASQKLVPVDTGNLKGSAFTRRDT